jgi:hypothetical protein
MVEVQTNDCCHADSQHVYGNAVDIPTSNQAQWIAVEIAALQANACVEPHGNYSHVHAQWKNPNTPGYPGCPLRFLDH